MKISALSVAIQRKYKMSRLNMIVTGNSTNLYTSLCLFVLLNRKVTLIGHSAGAASAMFHMTSPRAAGRFHRVVLMSGSSLAPWAMGFRVRDASVLLAKEVGCSTSSTDAILNCLRYLDANRISQAYYRVIDYYNGTDVFGPVVDNFLPKDLQYVARTPVEALERGEFPKIPVITGISSKDGLLMIS